MASSGLGALLVEEGILTETDRRTIKSNCGSNGPAFARGVIALGLLDEDELASLLASRTRWRLAAKDLGAESDTNAVSMLDRPLLERLEVLPLKADGKRMTVAMVDPLDRETVRQLEFFSGLQVTPVIATLSQIRTGLAKLFKDFTPPPSRLEEFVTNHATAASRRLQLVDLQRNGGTAQRSKGVQAAAVGNTPGALDETLDDIFDDDTADATDAGPSFVPVTSPPAAEEPFDSVAGDTNLEELEGDGAALEAGGDELAGDSEDGIETGLEGDLDGELGDDASATLEGDDLDLSADAPEAGTAPAATQSISVEDLAAFDPEGDGDLGDLDFGAETESQAKAAEPAREGSPADELDLDAAFAGAKSADPMEAAASAGAENDELAGLGDELGSGDSFGLGDESELAAAAEGARDTLDGDNDLDALGLSDDLEVEAAPADASDSLELGDDLTTESSTDALDSLGLGTDLEAAPAAKPAKNPAPADDLDALGLGDDLEADVAPADAGDSLELGDELTAGAPGDDLDALDLEGDLKSKAASADAGDSLELGDELTAGAPGEGLDSLELGDHLTSASSNDDLDALELADDLDSTPSAKPAKKPAPAADLAPNDELTASDDFAALDLSDDTASTTAAPSRETLDTVGATDDTLASVETLGLEEQGASNDLESNDLEIGDLDPALVPPSATVDDFSDQDLALASGPAVGALDDDLDAFGSATASSASNADDSDFTSTSDEAQAIEAAASLNRTLVALTLAVDAKNALSTAAPTLVEAGLARGLALSVHKGKIEPLLHWSQQPNALKIERDKLNAFVTPGLTQALSRLFVGWSTFGDGARADTLKPFALWNDASNALMATMTPASGGKQLAVIVSWDKRTVDKPACKAATLEIAKKIAQKL